MALRKCPDCEAMVSPKAAACPRCGCPARPDRAKRRGMGAGTLLLLGLLAMVAALFALSRRPPPATPPPSPRPARAASPGDGEAAIIHAPGDAGAWLAVDDAAWAEMLRAQSQSDPAYMAELARLGRAFHARDGTRVRVVRKAMASSLVRVAGGVRDGLSGRVQAEFVAPDPSPREGAP